MTLIVTLIKGRLIIPAVLKILNLSSQTSGLSSLVPHTNLKLYPIMLGTQQRLLVLSLSQPTLSTVTGPIARNTGHGAIGPATAQLRIVRIAILRIIVARLRPMIALLRPGVALLRPTTTILILLLILRRLIPELRSLRLESRQRQLLGRALTMVSRMLR
jgi:hypothetical protein